MSLGSGVIIIKLAENYFWLTEEKVNVEPWDSKNLTGLDSR